MSVQNIAGNGNQTGSQTSQTETNQPILTTAMDARLAEQAQAQIQQAIPQQQTAVNAAPANDQPKDLSDPDQLKQALQEAVENAAEQVAEEDQVKAEVDETVDAEEFALEMPDGVDFDQEAIDKFKSFAKEKGLKSEDANGLLKMHMEMRLKETRQFNEDIVKNTVRQNNVWLEQIKKDPDFGGTKYRETEEKARTFLRRIGGVGDELRADIKKTGIWNMPSLVKALALAETVTSEAMPTGGTVGGKREAPSMLELAEDTINKAQSK